MVPNIGPFDISLRATFNVIAAVIGAMLNYYNAAMRQIPTNAA